MDTAHNYRRGFIKKLILIVLALIILKFVFNITLKDIINSEVVKDIWQIIKYLYELLLDAIKVSWKFFVLALAKTKEFIHSLNISK